MYNLLFPFQPPGDTPTRKSFYDALLCGCIPVIFYDAVDYPYDTYIDYKQFTVYIPAVEILRSKVDFIDALLKIPEDKLHRLQAAGRRIAPLLQYSMELSVPATNDAGLDAVDMALYEIAMLDK